MIFHGILDNYYNIKGKMMIQWIRKLYRKKKNNKIDNYYTWIKRCLNNGLKEITVEHFDIIITSLYKDIKDYQDAINLLVNHDYTTYIPRTNLPPVKEQEIPFKELLKDNNGYYYIDYNSKYKEIMEKLLKLSEIYDILKDSDTNVKIFNRRILELYITNMIKITQRLNLCKEG